jgi:hypothetical protein
MTRLSRLVFAAALVAGAGCSGAPTAPTPTPNTMNPEAGALFDCRAGWDVPNGKAC